MVACGFLGAAGALPLPEHMFALLQRAAQAGEQALDRDRSGASLMAPLSHASGRVIFGKYNLQFQFC